MRRDRTQSAAPKPRGPVAIDCSAILASSALPVLLALTLGVLLFFLAPVFRGLVTSGFPLDDGWIHATYARNLAEHGQFALNPGEPSTGTTSLLWTVLLAGVTRAGLDAVTAAWLLAGASLLLLVAIWHRVLRSAGVGPVAAAASAAAIPLSGITLWWTLSGMETITFLLLAVLAMHAFIRHHTILSAFWLALLVLARPEGLLLAPVLAAAAWHRDRSTRAALPLLASAAAGVILYIGWNLAVTGEPYTSTLAGRRWLAHGGRIPDTNILTYPADFATMLLRWLRILGASILRHASPATWIAATTAALLLAWRLFTALRGEAASHRSLATILCTWALLHAAAYAALLPYPGHAGRYLAPLLLPLLALPAIALRNAASRPFPLSPLSSLSSLTAIIGLIASLLLSHAAIANWSTIWTSSVDHINHVHRRAAEWVKGHTDPQSRIAAFDIGALAYFSERYVIDLGGLADPAAAAYMHGHIDGYIVRRGADYVAMIAPYEGIDTPGWIPRALGYGHSGLILRHTVAEFHIPRSDYRRHIASTGNAYPRVLIEKTTRKLEKS